MIILEIAKVINIDPNLILPVYIAISTSVMHQKFADECHKINGMQFALDSQKLR
jgi:hypothetical protein